jgi:hypothetical protein
MPIIKRVQKIEPKQVGFRIDAALAGELTAYSVYTNVPAREIVAAALRHTIDSDPDFCKQYRGQPAIKTVTPRKAAVQQNAA